MSAHVGPADHAEVLLLSPSAGLGGGIERYVETLEWAFRAQAVTCERVDLEQPGIPAHWRMLRNVSSRWRHDRGSARIVAAHRALLPVAVALRRRWAAGITGISVVCHGTDVWGSAVRPRWWLEKQAMRSPGVRVVAVSSFTAGVVDVGCHATVLAPGLSRPWFDELARAGARSRGAAQQIRLVTAFRLADWRDKGLPELLKAIRLSGRPDVCLTICGSGTIPAELEELTRDVPWCRIRSSLTDPELARELAAADLFVLATRTRSGRCPSGEGFGLVLLEAQVAGTPVVAPACGGSRDAYLEGVTGVAPTDESARALGQQLSEMLRDRNQLSEMGRKAAHWAQARYDPELYAAEAVGRLL